MDKIFCVPPRFRDGMTKILTPRSKRVAYKYTEVRHARLFTGSIETIAKGVCQLSLSTFELLESLCLTSKTFYDFTLQRAHALISSIADFLILSSIAGIQCYPIEKCMRIAQCKLEMDERCPSMFCLNVAPVIPSCAEPIIELLRRIS